MMLYPDSRRLWSLALAIVVATAGSGCMSVLSTASLRDLFVGTDDHAAEAEIPSGPGDADAENDSADAERRAAAIEEAISRLSKIDHLDDSARDTLVATLQRTDQEDWPVVVDTFAESLASSPAAHTVAKADLDMTSLTVRDIPALSVPHELSVPHAMPEPMEAADAPEPIEPEPTPPVDAASAPAPVAATGVMPTAMPTEPTDTVAVSLEAPPSDDAVEPAPVTTEPFLLRNACFATRVQAWGVVDRFAADRFRPGQEVIVYFELDGLTAGESAAGHTTCIDSRLRLVTENDATVHEWTFEPLAETCKARRHDYFARYMIRIPAEAAPGPHRVELAVTDTLSGQKAVEAIDLEILAPPHPAE